ncbi:MAG: response regulator [Rhodospirillales bacterium]
MFDQDQPYPAIIGPLREGSCALKDTDAVTLPAGVEILPPPYAPRDSITGITVLIVDGSRFYRDLIKSAMASQGVWAFIEASTISEAKKRLTDVNQVDLIIIEHELEGEGGIDFSRRVRRSQTTFDAAIPIVMVSAATREDVVVEARNAGVHEFICKPFDIGTVVNRVKRPFEHPRKFVIAPNYVGPDRRWERHSNLDEHRRAEDEGVAVALDEPVVEAPVKMVADEFEATIDRYQRSRPVRKGLDRFKPYR